jgi:hypothetical protein
MNANDFVIFFRQLINKDAAAFISNMEKLGIEDKQPQEWASLFIKWLELGSKEDASRAYKELFK